MKEFYLLDYIKSSNCLENSLLDSIRYELDQHIYFYGAHFLNPKEKYEVSLFEEFIKPYLIKVYVGYKRSVKNNDDGRKKILSNCRPTPQIR